MFYKYIRGGEKFMKSYSEKEKQMGSKEAKVIYQEDG